MFRFYLGPFTVRRLWCYLFHKKDGCSVDSAPAAERGTIAWRALCSDPVGRWCGRCNNQFWQKPARTALRLSRRTG